MEKAESPKIELQRSIQTIELPKIELERYTLSMSTKLFELFQSILLRPDMSFYLPWIKRDIKTEEHALEYIKNSLRKEEAGEKISRSIHKENDSEIAGEISFVPNFETKEAVIGYFLGPDYTKQGIATAALELLTKQILSQNLQPVLYIYPKNIPSALVAERCKFELSETVYIHNKDMHKYLFSKS